MPGPAHHRTNEAVTKAVQTGRVHTKEIDSSVLTLLWLLRNTGKFIDRVDTPVEKAVDRPEHRALIREAGGEGIVLLKNKDNILPLSPKSIGRIAMLGPLAKYAAAHGGGSASLNCHYKISPYEAFKERLGSNIEITHSKGMMNA
jgi:beta-glucosidase